MRKPRRWLGVFRKSRLHAIIPAAILLIALSAAPAVPQTLSADAQALATAKSQALLAQRRAAALELQAARAADDAARARAKAAAVASRIVSAEADVAAAEARIRIVEELRARQRARLAARQQPIVRLAAGLQTLARRPPALALVQRGSIADLVHVRAVLAGQLPLVRARTEGLRREVAEGLRLQAQADFAAATLRYGRALLARQRADFAALETRHRVRAQRLVDSAMTEEDRATALGEDARDIVDLMGRVGERAVLSARLASLPGPLPRPRIPGHVPQAVPQSDGTVAGSPPYRLPVSGRLLTGLGEISDSGVRARGLTLAAAAGARVVAPAAGRIVYAGPFRDYGRIVILDHGGGWTSLVTGISDLVVRVGQTIDRGGQIGRAAATRQGLTVELRHHGRPIDIVPLVAAG